MMIRSVWAWQLATRLFCAAASESTLPMSLRVDYRKLPVGATELVGSRTQRDRASRARHTGTGPKTPSSSRGLLPARTPVNRIPRRHSQHRPGGYRCHLELAAVRAHVAKAGSQPLGRNVRKKSHARARRSCQSGHGTQKCYCVVRHALSGQSAQVPNEKQLRFPTGGIRHLQHI